MKKTVHYWICLLVLALPLQGMAVAGKVFCHSATSGHPIHTLEHHADHDHDGLDDSDNHQLGALQAPTPEHQSTPHHACSHCAQCCSVSALPLSLPFTPTPVQLEHAWLPTLHILHGAYQGFYLERPPRILFV